MTETLTEAKEGPLAGYSEEPKPLGSYTAIMAIFNAAVGASLVAARRSGSFPNELAQATS